MIIRNFIEGVNRCGDKGLVTRSEIHCRRRRGCDTRLCTQEQQEHTHLVLRKNIFENQIRKNKRCIIVDSSLFLWKDPAQTRGYPRYGYDGIFPTQQNIVM